jgi:peroxiredoxin Q/BCP
MPDELAVGDPAPAFNVPAVTRQGETRISPEEFRGRSSVVLYFYPKDDTPGCTTQACGFRDQYAEFAAVGSAILGVSPDDQASHVKFAEKYALPFPLLADPDHAVAEAYGVWKEKTNYGKTYMGIERTTFVIDKGGKIAKIYPRVKVDQHAEQVLEFVKGL